MNRESQTFGSRLRAERERRGISLDSIAENTKIKKSFLEGLERGDFSKWPAGTVFRRAYVRDYAAAIGLAPEPVVVDFIRLVPVDEESPAPPPLALTFDTGSTWRRRLPARRARAAAIDAGGLLALGGILALLTGISIWTAGGTLAFVYYPVAYALWGRSLASRYLETRRTRGQVIAVCGAARGVGEMVASSAPQPLARPAETVVNHLEAVVDPLLLSAANRSHSAHVPQETATH